MALACVLNNWIEVRSDASKICFSQRRPIPLRDDSIGPWLDNISFLAWLGTLTTSTLIVLFRGSDAEFEFDRRKVIYLLVVVFIAEHGYWIIDRAMNSILKRIKTKGEIEVMREEYILRRNELNAVELMSDQSLNGTKTEAGRNVSEDQPPEFWGRRSVENTVQDAKELLTRKKERKIE